MVRLQVVLDSSEAKALNQWAESELREPRDQIRFVLRQALKERGLLQDSGKLPATEAHETATSNNRPSGN